MPLHTTQELRSFCAERILWNPPAISQVWQRSCIQSATVIALTQFSAFLCCRKQCTGTLVVTDVCPPPGWISTNCSCNWVGGGPVSVGGKPWSQCARCLYSKQIENIRNHPVDCSPYMPGVQDARCCQSSSRLLVEVKRAWNFCNNRKMIPSQGCCSDVLLLFCKAAIRQPYQCTLWCNASLILRIPCTDLGINHGVGRSFSATF